MQKIKSENGVVPLAVLFIGLFALLLGAVIGNSTFDKGLPHDTVADTTEYK